VLSWGIIYSEDLRKHFMHFACRQRTLWLFGMSSVYRRVPRFTDVLSTAKVGEAGAGLKIRSSRSLLAAFLPRCMKTLHVICWQYMMHDRSIVGYRGVQYRWAGKCYIGCHTLMAPEHLLETCQWLQLNNHLSPHSGLLCPLATILRLLS
jgi:hypothetical protein